MTWIFLSSGFLLGWSLGANNAGNIFGPAVGTRMVKFRTAALIASIFVILGAVISGAGAAHTYGKLGAINAIAGSFTAALSAALTVFWMTKFGLPVSTTQAIVGAIIGWDIFSGNLIDTTTLSKILSTWVASPIISGIISFVFYIALRHYLGRVKIHILEMDLYTRIGLILVAAFGAYSLGANNIANVMGVFISSNPFRSLDLGIFKLKDIQVLFLAGGVFIAIGIFTYSYRVIKTVGNDIFKLSPIAALIALLSESIVLFIFASQRLERLLISLGLPPIPLVPVSSSQAVVGGVIGVAIAKKGWKMINYRLLIKIVMGWIFTPVSAGVLTFFSLFVMQNVFTQPVYYPKPHVISDEVIEKLSTLGINDPQLTTLEHKVFKSPVALKNVLKEKTGLSSKQILKVIELSEVDSLLIDSTLVDKLLDPYMFTHCQLKSLKKLHGQLFVYKWQLKDRLQKMCKDWQYIGDKLHDRDINEKLDIIFKKFRISEIRKLRSP